MEQHWKLRDLGLTIVFSVIYFAVVLAATIMGGIHPLLYLFVTALMLSWHGFHICMLWQKCRKQAWFSL